MIVFDVEADNLLDDATKIHCLSYTSDGENYKTLFDYSYATIYHFLKKYWVFKSKLNVLIPFLCLGC
jgi:putative heme iron utilization protein